MTRPADIQVDAGAGLSTTEARLRLSKIGPNEPVSSRRTSGLVQILLLFINPLAIILLVASAISAAVGEVLNASIIALMVLLSAVLNFVQTYRSQRAVERIRKEVAPTATVLRDGNWTEIPRRELCRTMSSGSRRVILCRRTLVCSRFAIYMCSRPRSQESHPLSRRRPSTCRQFSQDTSDDHKVFLGTSVVSRHVNGALTQEIMMKDHAHQ